MQFIEGDFEDYLTKLQDPQVQHSTLSVCLSERIKKIDLEIYKWR